MATLSGSSVAWIIVEILAEKAIADESISGPLVEFAPSRLKYHNILLCVMSESFRFKQVLVVRLDLDMGRGKAAVQCAHAAVSAAEEARTHLHDWWKLWMEEGQMKVALKVPDLDSVLELERKGRSKGIPVHLVRDRGLTQVPPGTITCLGLGPAPADLLDSLTGNLTLL